MKIISVLAVLMLIAGSVTAWGPNTHMYITDEALEDCESDPSCANSIIYQTIKDNEDAYRCGYMFPDVTVIYYYLKWDNYEATHSWAFCSKALEVAETDAERAAAYGCMSHLIADAQAHNYFIPTLIEDTSIPNDVIHPIVEGLVETNYIDNVRAPRSMERVDDYLPLFNRAGGVDYTQEAHLLRTALGGQDFYNSQYTVNEETFILQLWHAGANFLIWLDQDVVDIMDDDLGSEYISKTIDDTFKYYKTGTYPPLDPSGFRALDVAAGRTKTKMYIMFIVVPILLFILYFILNKLGLIEKGRELIRRLR